MFQRFMRMPSLLLTFATFATLVACDARPPASTETPRRENSKAVQPGNESDFRQRQMAFLNRLREADPQQRTIDRALLNEQNELGLILDRSVDMDKIPALMKTMLAQMAHEFPNQDLTVIAYAPSNPPRKIGTARVTNVPSESRELILERAKPGLCRSARRPALRLQPCFRRAFLSGIAVGR